MKLTELMQEAARVQIKFSNREDVELQVLKRQGWENVAKEIERLIDEKFTDERYRRKHK